MVRATGYAPVIVAGAPGIEPGPSVLETDVLAVEHHAPPLRAGARLEARGKGDWSSVAPRPLPLAISLHFLVRRVLPAEPAVLLSLKAIRIILLILHCGVIPLLADRTGHGNDVPHPLTPQFGAVARGAGATARAIFTRPPRARQDASLPKRALRLFVFPSQSVWRGCL